MNHVEVEGVSIDEAIDKALESLGVSREQVDIEIIASPTKGVLGIGGRKARVRATIREPMSLDPFPQAATKEIPPAEEAVSDLPTKPSSESVSTSTDPGFAVRAQSLLQEVLDRMGFPVSVDVREEEQAVHLNIRGDESGVLIGRHGQTLDALEYFVHRALSRDQESGRISVDCEEYRVRRQGSLEGMAGRLAQQVKGKGKAMTMEALSPRDRRIVHLALQTDPEVTTRSSGEGYYRKLVIAPAAERERRASRPPRPRRRSGNR